MTIVVFLATWLGLSLLVALLWWLPLHAWARRQGRRWETRTQLAQARALGHPPRYAGRKIGDANAERDEAELATLRRMMGVVHQPGNGAEGLLRD